MSLTGRGAFDSLTSGTDPAFDCEGAAFLVLAESLREGIGDVYFLQAFGSKRIADLTITRLGKPEDAKIGDWGYMANDSTYAGGNWTGENIIYVGNGKWWGYGSIVPMEGYTIDWWNTKLLSEYNNTRAPSQQIRKVPGWEGGIRFLDIGKIGMKMFDNNTSGNE